jgi:hypothetical protein
MRVKLNRLARAGQRQVIAVERAQPGVVERVVVETAKPFAPRIVRPNPFLELFLDAFLLLAGGLGCLRLLRLLKLQQRADVIRLRRVNDDDALALIEFAARALPMLQRSKRKQPRVGATRLPWGNAPQNNSPSPRPTRRGPG